MLRKDSYRYSKWKRRQIRHDTLKSKSKQLEIQCWVNCRTYSFTFFWYCKEIWRQICSNFIGFISEIMVIPCKDLATTKSSWILSIKKYTSVEAKRAHIPLIIHKHYDIIIIIIKKHENHVDYIEIQKLLGLGIPNQKSITDSLIVNWKKD